MKVNAIQGFRTRDVRGLLRDNRQDAVRLSVKLTMIRAAVALVILGVHGLYAHFALAGVAAIGESTGSSQMFLMVTVPWPLSDMVQWTTIKGAQSWYVPLVLFAVGMALFSWQKRVHIERDAPGITVLGRRLVLW